MADVSAARSRAGLFVTCLVDLWRPSVGFAAAKLIEAAGATVEVPRLQTCCGQPAYNAGDRATARALAISTMRAFQGFDYVVVPSGSCAAMLKIHYPELLSDDETLAREAREFGGRVFELTTFLAEVRGLKEVPGRFRGRVAYHDACSARRELGIGVAPRRLLAAVDGLTLAELGDAESCCGFGGLFSVKYGDISEAIVAKKAAAVVAAGVDLLVGPDLGCLLNIAGKLTRADAHVSCRHIAEVLSGELEEPPIGHSQHDA